MIDQSLWYDWNKNVSNRVIITKDLKKGSTILD